MADGDIKAIPAVRQVPASTEGVKPSEAKTSSTGIADLFKKDTLEQDSKKAAVAASPTFMQRLRDFFGMAPAKVEALEVTEQGEKKLTPIPLTPVLPEPEEPAYMDPLLRDGVKVTQRRMELLRQSVIELERTIKFAESSQEKIRKARVQNEDQIEKDDQVLNYINWGKWIAGGATLAATVAASGVVPGVALTIPGLAKGTMAFSAAGTAAAKSYLQGRRNKEEIVAIEHKTTLKSYERSLERLFGLLKESLDRAARIENDQFDALERDNRAKEEVLELGRTNRRRRT